MQRGVCSSMVMITLKSEHLAHLQDSGDQTNVERTFKEELTNHLGNLPFQLPDYTFLKALGIHMYPIDGPSRGLRWRTRDYQSQGAYDRTVTISFRSLRHTGKAQRFQMRQVAGYFVSYSDTRAIMDKLQVPDKGVDDIMLKHPINDWLAKTNRYEIVCTTVGHIYSGYRDAEGVFLITRIKIVHHSRSKTTEPPIERDKDKYVKKWLVDEGGVKENCLQWMSFPDADKLHLLADGTRPSPNNFKGPWSDYRLTPEQNTRLMGSGKGLDDWVAEVTANGEAVERIWPPQ